MSKWWEHIKERNTHCLYCSAFPRKQESEDEERRPIAVLHTDTEHDNEQYTYDCCVVLNPGYSIPLKAKSIDEAKKKIEKAIIEYLELEFDEHFTKMQIIDEELEELKRG